MSLLFAAVPHRSRVARSTADLLALVERIKAKGRELVILSMGGQTLDTSSPTSKLMLSMLAALAEFERDLMLERQREGIATAKAEGRYLGRNPLHGHRPKRSRSWLARGQPHRDRQAAGDWSDVRLSVLGEHCRLTAQQGLVSSCRV